MKRSDDGVRRNPQPSLLRSLMTEHLDPGYAAAARARAHGKLRASRTSNALWLVVGIALIAFVVSVAYVRTMERVPGTEHVRADLLAKVDEAEADVDHLAAERSALTDEVESARAEALAGDAKGSDLLARLHEVEVMAGAEAVHGEGLEVTLTDPVAPPNLSDSSQRSVGGRAVVLDRDLQSVVNAMWASGAEAVAVNDVRVGPGVTVRQAGGAMLVDNQPVFSPYTVSAIGPQGPMQTHFVVSDAYLRLTSVQQLYDIEFSVTESDDLSLPAATVQEIRVAHEPEGGR